VSKAEVASRGRDESGPELIELYRRMLLIREAEKSCGALFAEGAIPGFIHLSDGQEAVSVGVMASLRPDDTIASTHRGHGHALAKGLSLDGFFRELMGKADGACKGRGGSMHVADLSVGMLGANGIVGAGSPIAVGAAFADKYRKKGQVAVTFFGDGATNIGAFHEAANMACALKLPVVFACENNEYGEFTPRSKTMAITDIVDRAAGYGMPGVIVDGMDVIAVHEAATEAVARARRGEGPSLIEAKTYRFYNHHGIQNLGLKYRPDAEVDEWKARDPIFRFEERLIENGTATSEQIEAIWAELRADIDTAIKFADDSPLPDPSQVMVDVYTGGLQ
jgi:acetoin:2,6-dichlorophenolindophenol oxidoreductase subunit alpha